MSWYPDLPHDQAGGHGGTRAQTQCVVIHATDNTASDTAEAKYAEHRSDEVSAHFYDDEDSVTQALDTDVVAYGCYPIGNSRSVQFELVGLSNRLVDATLRMVAPIVARVCRQYGIPVRHVGPADLKAGAKGICGHGDVTRAWGEGDHADPGDSFPWSTFISYVEGADMELNTVVPSASEPGFDRTVENILTDLWHADHGVSQETNATVKHLAADVAGLKASIASLATPKLDMTALVEALKPVIGGAVATELAKRLQE